MRTYSVTRQKAEIKKKSYMLWFLYKKKVVHIGNNLFSCP